jgi:hypothetical protein
VNLVKGMMAENLTIEDIQRSFARFKEEIGGVERGVRDLISSFEREARGPSLEIERRRELEKEINEAKRAAGDLLRRITGLEALLSARDRRSVPGTATGGGNELF